MYQKIHPDVGCFTETKLVVAIGSAIIKVVYNRQITSLLLCIALLITTDLLIYLVPPNFMSTELGGALPVSEK